jgi:hypothetical protein
MRNAREEQKKAGGKVCRKRGGAVPAKNDENSKVFAEADRGKNIGSISGSKGKDRLDRKCGGKVHRASGGAVGADSHPYSSAGRGLRKGGKC